MPWRTAPAWPLGRRHSTLICASYLSASARWPEGLDGHMRMRFDRKVIFKRAAVDDDFARASGQANAGHGGFAPAVPRYCGAGFGPYLY